MATLLNLVKELRALGVGLNEIEIPYNWYRQLLDYAQELIDTDQEEDEDIQ